MEKIIEIKGEDFLKGFSKQGGFANGGIFRSMENFNPFEREGFLQPSLSPTELTAPAASVKVINSFNISGTGYFYAQTPQKLYRYTVASPYTQVDKTAQITVTEPIAGAIVWADPTTKTRHYVYAQGGGSGVKVFSNALDVASASEVEILSSVPTSSLTDIRPMCIGADKNLYVGTKDAVSQITSGAGTAGNTASKFLIDSGFTVRQLLNDGRYLVIMADNNHETTTSRTQGDFQCRIYFWDMAKPTADVIWDISDSYIIGGAFKDNRVYVFGYNGIYVCNLVTSPQMIWDFRGNSTVTKRPAHTYQIAAGSNDIFWADGNSTTGWKIFAIRGDTVYSPYTTHNASAGHTSILAIGDTIVAGTSTPKLFLHNVGSTRANLVAQTANMTLKQPFAYKYARIVLRTPLSSGQEVSLILYNSNDNLISNTQTKTYAINGDLKHLLFKPNPTSGSVTKFEDISVYVNTISGPAIERVVVYGEPMTDQIQE